jgi:hypothetical protein
MRILAAGFLLVSSLLQAQKSGADSSVENILQVKRIYVSPLTGGAQADALRDLIIASLTNTKLFILTDNSERADAILKGAADDKAFTDTFDTTEGQTAHENVSKNSGGTPFIRGSGLSVGNGGSMDESHHIRERKHEAYAAVRLCNKDGDVLWSTTQESLGAKFRGAGADVAARIARQITLDYERERRLAQPGTAIAPPGPSVTVK